MPEIAGLAEQPQDPERRAKIGELLLMLGQYADALSLFSDCARLEPDNPAHHERLGRALSALGRLAEAEAAFAQAAQYEPGNPRFLTELGWARMLQGKYPQAETAFREAAKIEPADPEHQFALGQALASQDKKSEAEDALLRATHLDDGNPDYLDALGEILAAQGRPAEAEPIFRRATELDPTVLSYRLHLAHALLGQQRHDEAAAEFQMVIDVAPDIAAAHAGLGNALLGQGRRDEAEAEFQVAIGLDPDIAAGHGGLGHVLVGRAQHERAEAAFQRAQHADPVDPRYRLELGRAMAAQGRYAEAADVFRQLSREYPDNPQYHADLGRALLGQGLGDDAERELRTAVWLDPENASHNADLGEALLSRNRFDEAETFFRRALDRDGANPAYRAGLARALSGKGDYATADAMFGELSDDAHAAEYRAAWGAAMSARGRHHEAQRLFRQAMRIEPENAKYRALLGRSLLLDGRLHDAKTVFIEAVALAPGDAAYRADLASALSGLGELPEAEDSLLQAVRLEPGHARYLADLSRLLAAQDRIAEATLVLRRAVDRDPGNPRYLGALGHSLLRQRQHADAEQALDEALRLDPGNPSYLTDLGSALAGQGKYAQAEAAYRRAMEADPQDVACRSGLADALAAQGSRTEAVAVLQAALAADPGNRGLRAKLGVIMVHEGELPRAVTILTELQQGEPGQLNANVADLERTVFAAYDDAIVDHACRLADQRSDKRDLQRRGIAWQQYKDCVAKTAATEAARIRPVYSEWSETKSREEAAPGDSQPTARGSRIKTIGALCLFAAALAAGGSLLADLAALSERARLIIDALSATAATLGVALPVVYFLRGRQGKNPPILPSVILENQLTGLISNLVLKPAETAAPTVTWMDSAEDRVSVRDGAELGAKAELPDLISTEANKRLELALTRRNGSWVALAGRRGSGKTELARTVTELRSTRLSPTGVRLMLWAPTKKDDVHSFLLRVLKELCIAIISINQDGSENRWQSFLPERRGQSFYQTLIAAILVSLGGAVLISRLIQVKIGTIMPFLVAGILIAAGLAMFVTSRSPRRRPVPGAPIPQATVDRVTDLLRRVEFIETYTLNAQLAISGYGVSTSATRGSQFARLPLSDFDIVRELRDTVESVVEEKREVVIAIDDLDKMEDADEAMAFVKQIKVLFRIPGCSFVVSLPEEGQAAFHSSFDEVVPLEMLTQAQSREFLRKRSGSITDTQGLLCHCLSGGLPWELLRSVRLLAQVAGQAEGQDEEGSDPPLRDIFPRVLQQRLKEQLSQRVDAAARTSWLRTWADEGLTERLLAGICTTRTLEQSLPLFDEGSQVQIAATDKNYIEIYIAILHTIRQAFQPGGPITGLANGSPKSDDILAGLGLIAESRWDLESDIASSWERLHEARTGLGMAPLTGGPMPETAHDGRSYG